MKAPRVLFLALALGLSGAQAAGFECPLPRATQPLFLQQRFEELVPILEKALADLPPQPAELAGRKGRICLTSLYASSLSHVRRLDEALALQSGNAAQAARLLAEDDPTLLEAQLHLATIQQKRGNYDASIPVLRALVPKVERVHGSTSLDLVTVLRNTATALHWVGNFADALPYDERRLQVARQMRPGVDCAPEICQRAVADSHAGVADTLRRLRRDAEAEEQLRAALNIYGVLLPPTDPKVLDAQLTLASVLANQGRGAEAEALERQVAATAERTLGARHALTQKAKGNLAVSITRKQPEAAAQIEEQRVHDLRASLGPGHPDTLQATHSLAVIYTQRGDFERALPLLRSAVVALLARPDRLDFDDRSRAAFERFNGVLADDYLALLLRAGRIPDAVLLTEQLKARGLAGGIGAFDFGRGLEPAVLAERKMLRGEIGRADQAIALARSLGRPDPAQIAVRARLSAQWNESQARGGERLAEAGQVPGWTRKLFDAAPAVVSYRFVRKRLYAFVVMRERQRAVLVDTADVVRPTVEALRLAMRDLPGSRASDNEPLPLWRTQEGGYLFAKAQPEGTVRAASVDEVLAFLHSKLVAPLQPYLPPQDKLLISVDGNLAHVPFDGLPHEGGRLGDRYTVALLPTFAVHEALVARAQRYAPLPRDTLLAMGGAPYSRIEKLSPDIYMLRERPVLQAMDVKVAMQAVRTKQAPVQLALANVAMGWRDLPGSLEEVRLVAAALGVGGGTQGTVLTREQASEAALNDLAAQGQLEKFRYLHFATHGFLSDDEPSLSAVVLSQVRRAPGTDGYLTAAELASLRLQADLVVVSACDSGAQVAQDTGGAAGFAAALLEAGANSSMLTLWPVPDRETPRFMQKMYTALAAGEPPAAALQKTKRWAREQGMPRQLVDAFVYWGLP